MFKRLPGIGIQFKAYQNESTLRTWAGKHACVAEVVNRSFKADCTDFNCLNFVGNACLETNYEFQ